MEHKDTVSKLVTTTEEETPTRAAHKLLTPTQITPEPRTEEAETVSKMEEIEEKLNRKDMDVDSLSTTSNIME